MFADILGISRLCSFSPILYNCKSINQYFWCYSMHSYPPPCGYDCPTLILIFLLVTLYFFIILTADLLKILNILLQHCVLFLLLLFTVILFCVHLHIKFLMKTHFLVPSSFSFFTFLNSHLYLYFYSFCKVIRIIQHYIHSLNVHFSLF